MFKIEFTDEAISNLKKLEKDKSLAKRYKSVLKAFAYLEINPKHPVL